MRAYRFPQTETERMTVISRFGGVDFRTHSPLFPAHGITLP